MGISGNLARFACDEGTPAALEVAERWRDTLEEMAEVANGEQKREIIRLLRAVNHSCRSLANSLRIDRFCDPNHV